MIKRYVGTSDFPYSIDFDVTPVGKSKEIYEWCEQQFGQPLVGVSDNNQHCKWIKTMFGVRFKKKEHQHWFILRWANEQI